MSKPDYKKALNIASKHIAEFMGACPLDIKFIESNNNCKNFCGKPGYQLPDCWNRYFEIKSRRN